ncbi:MAG: hypothetical protein QW335_03845 [Candidatus Nezhaarchaeales archaeon]
MKDMEATERGLSTVISTVIITATLLVILFIAFYFATDMLEIQVQNSEFEQAKTAMKILDKTIADVALRPGAASSIPFNQRSGGIGLYEGEAINIMIYSDSSLDQSRTISSWVIKYRGGRMVSAAEVNLTQPVGLIVTDASKPLGYVRVEVGNGVWVVLDYNRVRITVNENLKVMDIYLIKLERGTTGGTGTVTVRVQSGVPQVETLTFNSQVRVCVKVGNQVECYPSDSGGVFVSAVRLIIVPIVVSIM